MINTALNVHPLVPSAFDEIKKLKIGEYRRWNNDTKII